MICALTVRTLQAGTFDDFRQAFMSALDSDNPPEGWVRFNMVRNVDNPDEVVTFGFFDGTVDELRATAAQDEQRADGQCADHAGSSLMWLPDVRRARGRGVTGRTP